MGGRFRRGYSGLALAVLLISVSLAFGAAPAGAQAVAVAGSATGSAIHAGAVQVGATRVADAEVAFSSAVFDSAGLANAALNEMQRPVSAASPGKTGYARGSGIEAGVAIAPDGGNQVIQAGKAEAFAPSPSSDDKQVGPVAVDPAIYASLARGNASSGIDGDGPCGTLGSDLARGLGYVADAQLVDTAANADTAKLDAPVVSADSPSPARSVAQTLSRTLLIPQINSQGTTLGPNLGLLSEVRQTIAPVTLLAGTANQLTVEVLGEWVLQVVASGTPGNAFVRYGPAATSPETPVLRTIDATGAVTNVLTFQQVTGGEGLVVAVPGVGTIVLGEDPRAIGGDAASKPAIAANGTSASAAVDVVRVKLLGQADATGAVTQRVADLRVGHMEAKAVVPVGGVICPIPVTKVATPPAVSVNEAFVTKITVRNPFDCPLTDVTVSDVITGKRRGRFRVDSTGPATTLPSGERLSTATLNWGLGTLAPGGTKEVTVTVTATRAGDIVDNVTASGTLACPPTTALGNTRVAGKAIGTAAAIGNTTAVAALSGVSGEVRVKVSGVLGARLARTGPPFDNVAAGMGLIASGTGLLGWVLARARRRR